MMDYRGCRLLLSHGYQADVPRGGNYRRAGVF